MSHQEFDRMLTKYLPANTLRNIQDVVESLKSKVSHLWTEMRNFMLKMDILHKVNSCQHPAIKSGCYWL